MGNGINGFVHEPIRVWIVDDQSLFLSGLSALLSLHPGFVVVGTARSAAELLANYDASLVDVLLLDVGLPDQNGIETAALLRASGTTTSVLIVSNYDAKEDVLHAIEAGVKGYVLKDAEADVLLTAIREVANGRCFLDGRLLGLMMETLAAQPLMAMHTSKTAHSSGVQRIQSQQPLPHPVPAHKLPPQLAQGVHVSRHYALTERESDVLRLMANGMSNAEIARTLYIAPKTARNYTTNILQKLGVSDRTKAAVMAITQELLQ